jgi:SAM-dependent methyltransferase/diadenosine tetraphosphate (Ap4A) HIT family hydrolase
MNDTDTFPQACDLCQEILLDGTAVTGANKAASEKTVHSRLIWRTHVVDVLAGLGCLVPGYVLLTPRRHVRSIGELSQGEMMHVFDVAWLMIDRIVEVSGGNVVLVEHGSSGYKNGPSGACIDHAHIHLFPLDLGTDSVLFQIPGSRLIDNLTELSTPAQNGKNYYYCASGGIEHLKGYVAVEPQLECQQARRIWAQVLGRNELWDWALFPFLANAQLTATKLRCDKLSLDETGVLVADLELVETLRAYNEAADWYAARTDRFPDKSTLRTEMTWLADHTGGPILDAGAGAGRDSAYLASFERSVIALDASAPLLAHVPKRKNISSMVGDVRRLLLDNNSVGAIWCSAVLLHLRREDVLRTFREFFRVLKIDGLVEISVKGGTGHASSAMPDHPWLRRHFFFYECGELKELANEAGLDVVRSWTEKEVDSSLVSQRWIKLLLRRPQS